MNTLASILEWQRQACQEPSDRDRSTALGVHMEEVAEMLASLGMPAQARYLDAVADSFKRFSADAAEALDPDRQALLDALCDQIVTAIGVAHRFGLDIHGALAEVNRSNWSKLVDGQFQYDANGKVIKPASYSPPNLAPFVSTSALCLDRPARVGSTIFGAGIHWGTVIHAAQMDYAQQPIGAPLAQKEGGAQ